MTSVGQGRPKGSLGNLSYPLPAIQLLAMDLDGTLMDDRMVITSQRIRRAITAAQERGVVVTLATGRMLDYTLPFARDLGITAPLICYQGGLIQAPGAEVPLYRATMDPALMREALDFRAQRGWHLVLYAAAIGGAIGGAIGDSGADGVVFLDERRHPDSFYHQMLGEQLVWVDDLETVLERHQPVKFLVFVEPHEAKAVLDELQERFGGQMELTQSHARIVEGNPLGVSKGNALHWLADHLEIPQPAVMAIGDQDNDASMVAWAGVGVAMGNGSPVVKGIADWIAPPVVDDGAAVAIERFILNAPRDRKGGTA